MRGARAFTLLKLLAAVTITALLAGLMLTLTVQVLEAWQRTLGRAAASAEAALVLDQLERDLQAALRSGTRNWLDVRLVPATALASHGWSLDSRGPIKPERESARLSPAAAPGRPPRVEDARFGRSGIWLRLVTHDYDGDTQRTQPCAVAYQVVRRPVTSSTAAPVRYALFREKLSAAATLDGALRDGFSVQSPGALNEPDNADVIAANVVDFGVWVEARQPDGSVTRLFPTEAGGTEFADSSAALTLWVMLRVLTPAGADRVAALEEGRIAVPDAVEPGEWWWREVESNSHVFVRRVESKAVAP